MRLGRNDTACCGGNRIYWDDVVLVNAPRLTLQVNSGGEASLVNNSVMRRPIRRPRRTIEITGPDPAFRPCTDSNPVPTSAVLPGLPRLQVHAIPATDRWAILDCPSRTGAGTLNAYKAAPCLSHPSSF